MSHTRFKLGFTRHRKIRGLSDAAFRLWASAMDHAREQLTDGALTHDDLDMVPKAPKRGATRSKLIEELVNAGLWEVTPGGWQVHDFLDWQDSAEQVRTRLAKARERMKGVRANVHANNDGTDAERANNVRSTDPPPLPPPSGSDSGEGGAGGHPPDPGSDDPGRETVCPLNLYERAEKGGIHAELAEALPAPIESVRQKTREFVSYWTIGGGQGKRRAAWMRRLREDIRRAHVDNKLKPPGAVEHDARNPGSPRPETCGPSRNLADFEGQP